MTATLFFKLVLLSFVNAVMFGRRSEFHSPLILPHSRTPQMHQGDELVVVPRLLLVCVVRFCQLNVVVDQQPSTSTVALAAPGRHPRDRIRGAGRVGGAARACGVCGEVVGVCVTRG
jgi:hypothetical protein